MADLNEQDKRRKFEQFFILTYPKVKAFAQKLLQSEEDAEDIAQDIFVKLWDSPELWEREETWNAYIYTMVRNQIYNFLKHKTVEQNYQTQFMLQNEEPLQGDVNSELYAKEVELLVKMSLERMPEQRRKVFVLSRKQGLSNQEIAEKLHLSVRTVERHIYLALQDLKKIILFALFSDSVA